ncbi:anthranilate synthase component I family protein [Desulfitobacterium metallireducens]|uniref:Anthranilate synthase n=1 Tax=Desulfitobacterium metallireducens DSM 15288 TaxID=871968 RepID=W0EAQ9_9FIRM|nr:anthranilate synthase component I family protein [Desulfitobacterium metallireducens]AHF07955.1 anthranilate synthase [Desulfitobacterium metallireducens DSM 15288]
MYVAQKEWQLDPYPSDPSNWISDLVRLGENLGEKCFALLEGKEGDHQRTYLGFGQGITLSRQTFSKTGLTETPDPLTHLRWFHQTHCLDSEKELESGLLGYLDYEWGLAWHKPSSSTATPDYFFRFCPINLILLPLAQKLTLEVFADDKKTLEFLLQTWCTKLNSYLTPFSSCSDFRFSNPSASSEVSSTVSPVTSLCPISPTSVTLPVSAPSASTALSPFLTVSPEAPSSQTIPQKELAAWHSNLSRDEFVKRVERIKAYVQDGDIFQAVPSQRFIKNVKIDPWAVYQQLRVLNPSPYLFCFFAEKETLVGSSPELLLSSRGPLIQTRPIAGTRPRGKTPSEDFSREQELLDDAKERAEHAMLVDLGRNDLGRVSQYGSVKVSQYAKIERFSHVMHLVSTVEGEIDPAYDSLDALKAVFPAGTLSGAPKVRALEILQELEPEPRGAYGGALGIVRWNGDLDFCITIRTLVITDKQVQVQAGAGIVFDSVPEQEFEETVHKAQALLKVVDDCVSCS